MLQARTSTRVAVRPPGLPGATSGEPTAGFVAVRAAAEDPAQPRRAGCAAARSAPARLDRAQLGGVLVDPAAAAAAAARQRQLRPTRRTSAVSPTVSSAGKAVGSAAIAAVRSVLVGRESWSSRWLGRIGGGIAVGAHALRVVHHPLASQVAATSVAMSKSSRSMPRTSASTALHAAHGSEFARSRRSARVGRSTAGFARLARRLNDVNDRVMQAIDRQLGLAGGNGKGARVPRQDRVWFVATTARLFY